MKGLPARKYSGGDPLVPAVLYVLTNERPASQEVFCEDLLVPDVLLEGLGHDLLISSSQPEHQLKTSVNYYHQPLTIFPTKSR